MKIKYIDLKNRALDWSVAKALGYEGGAKQLKNSEGSIIRLSSFWPSSNPAQSNFIILQNKINVIFDHEWVFDPNDKDDNGNRWYAYIHGKYPAYGEDNLEAAMRCFVNSKLGDYIDIPNEFINFYLIKYAKSKGYDFTDEDCKEIVKSSIGDKKVEDAVDDYLAAYET